MITCNLGNWYKMSKYRINLPVSRAIMIQKAINLIATRIIWKVRRPTGSRLILSQFDRWSEVLNWNIPGRPTVFCYWRWKPNRCTHLLNPEVMAKRLRRQSIRRWQFILTPRPGKSRYTRMYFVNGLIGSHWLIHKSGANWRGWDEIIRTRMIRSHNSNWLERIAAALTNRTTKPERRSTSVIKRLPGRRSMPVRADYVIWFLSYQTWMATSTGFRKNNIKTMRDTPDVKRVYGIVKKGKSTCEANWVDLVNIFRQSHNTCWKSEEPE
jgi:hypothetical protein